MPKLYKDGFRGRIICTHATRSLCSIMLLDSAFIQMKEAEYDSREAGRKIDPLYSNEDAKKVMDLFETYSYGKWHKIHPEVKVKFVDAGHILGSASVNLVIKENSHEINLAFSGDIGRPDRPILRDPHLMDPADYLICESTYGNRLHEEKPEEYNRLLHIIKRTCVEQKGKLIIPAFSVGRTQEIINIMDKMSNKGELPHLPVFVDSPLAIDATVIYGSHPECYDSALNEYLLTDPNPFGFKGLHYLQKGEESKKLNTLPGPAIIISASGMMTAGRIRHHMFHHLRDKRNTFLIVGYCAPGTPGRMLIDGISELTIHGTTVPVMADIEVMQSFSAHGDKKEMAEVIKNQIASCHKMFLIHGDPEVQEEFRSYLLENGFRNIEIPGMNETQEI